METKKDRHLLDELLRIKDFRREQGKRYGLVEFLTMTIMGVISGYTGYRELHAFMKANESRFTEILPLKHGVPSHVSIREMIMGLDFEEINEVFKSWVQKKWQNSGKKETLSVDGKAIGSTVIDVQSEFQSFISLVSIYGQESGLVLDVGKMNQAKEGEIALVQKMIEHFEIKNCLFTLDALHCQKKRPK